MYLLCHCDGVTTVVFLPFKIYAGLVIFAFSQGKVYVMYIGMDEVHDYKHWMKLATVSCHYGVRKI